MFHWSGCFISNRKISNTHSIKRFMKTQKLGLWSWVRWHTAVTLALGWPEERGLLVQGQQGHKASWSLRAVVNHNDSYVEDGILHLHKVQMYTHQSHRHFRFSPLNTLSPSHALLQ